MRAAERQGSLALETSQTAAQGSEPRLSAMGPSNQPFGQRHEQRRARLRDLRFGAAAEDGFGIGPGLRMVDSVAMTAMSPRARLPQAAREPPQITPMMACRAMFRAGRKRGGGGRCRWR